jgi:hypothetical protein
LRASGGRDEVVELRVGPLNVAARHW